MKNFKFIDWFSLLGMVCIHLGSWVFEDRLAKGISYAIGSAILLIWLIHTLLWTSKMRKQVERELKEYDEWQRTKK